MKLRWLHGIEWSETKTRMQELCVETAAHARGIVEVRWARALLSPHRRPVQSLQLPPFCLKELLLQQFLL